MVMLFICSPADYLVDMAVFGHFNGNACRQDVDTTIRRGTELQGDIPQTSYAKSIVEHLHTTNGARTARNLSLAFCSTALWCSDNYRSDWLRKWVGRIENGFVSPVSPRRSSMSSFNYDEIYSVLLAPNRCPSWKTTRANLSVEATRICVVKVAIKLLRYIILLFTIPREIQVSFVMPVTAIKNSLIHLSIFL